MSKRNYEQITESERHAIALGPVSVTALSAITVQLQLRVDNTGNAPLYAP